MLRLGSWSCRGKSLWSSRIKVFPHIEQVFVAHRLKLKELKKEKKGQSWHWSCKEKI